jgi:hypothetical protein
MPINHRKVPTGPHAAGPNSVGLDDWRDSLVGSGGVDGLPLLRLTGHQDGMDFAATAVQARTGLDVYSKAETDAAIAAVAGGGSSFLLENNQPIQWKRPDGTTIQDVIRLDASSRVLITPPTTGLGTTNEENDRPILRVAGEIQARPFLYSDGNSYAQVIIENKGEAGGTKKNMSLVMRAPDRVALHLERTAPGTPAISWLYNIHSNGSLVVGRGDNENNWSLAFNTNNRDLFAGGKLDVNGDVTMPGGYYLYGGGVPLIGWDGGSTRISPNGHNVFISGPVRGCAGYVESARDGDPQFVLHNHNRKAWSIGCSNGGELWFGDGFNLAAPKVKIAGDGNMYIPDGAWYRTNSRALISYDSGYCRIGGWGGAIHNTGNLHQDGEIYCGNIRMNVDNHFYDNYGKYLVTGSSNGTGYFGRNCNNRFNDWGGATWFTSNVTIEGTLYVGGIWDSNDGWWMTSPDYVFEREYTGRIEKFAQSPGARDYPGRLSLDQVEAHAREHWKLPQHGHENEVWRRSDDMLAELERLYLHLFDLNTRLRALESQ